MGPGPPGWGLGEGFTIPRLKKLPVRKTEMCAPKGLEGSIMEAKARIGL